MMCVCEGECALSIDCNIAMLFVCQGCFPPPCGSESLCTLLDEESMMKLCHSTTNDPSHDELQLQYYIIDGTTIVGLLEKPVAPDHGW